MDVEGDVVDLVFCLGLAAFEEAEVVRDVFDDVHDEEEVEEFVFLEEVFVMEVEAI